MITNVGMLDRALRALLGIGLMAWAATGGPAWAWVGAVPLFTAGIGFCPAYTMLGINTCPAKQD